MDLDKWKVTKGKYKNLSHFTFPEKQEWRRIQKKQCNDTRVRLGGQLARWVSLKKTLGLRNDPEVAQVLLDGYDRLESFEGPSIAVVPDQAESDSPGHIATDRGTPTSLASHSRTHSGLTSPNNTPPRKLPSHSSSENDQPALSTAKKVKDKGHQMMHEVSSTDRQQRTLQVRKHPSGVNLEYVQDGDVVYMYPPTVAEHESTQEAELSDEEMEEDEDGSALFQLLEEIEECHPEGKRHDIPLEDIFDIEDSCNNPADHQEEVEQSPDVDIGKLAGDKTFLGYTSSLQKLLEEIRVAPCPVAHCGSVPQPVTTTIGTALTVQWVCQNGHVSKRWSSQPKVRGNFVGDVGLSSATVLSGSSFPKVKMLCRCLNLGTCSEEFHEYVQRECTFPTIASSWEKVQRSLLDERRDKKITIAAGTRSNTHEHSSKYAPFTTLDYTTGDILNVSTIDRRKNQQDYGTLELEAFSQTMDLVKNNSIMVQEVVTDAQQQLKDYMSRQPSIVHSFDVWLGAKSVGRKVAMASQRSEFYHPLEPWTADITKHFLFCARQAGGERMCFISHWRGLLHHVVGNHEWVLGDGYGPARCLHDPIPPELEQEKLLQPGSLSHVALREIVLSEQLLWNSDYYSRNRHMSCLERFWPYLDAYVDEHVTYSHSCYKARNLLAAIDFQMHKERRQEMRNGTPVFKRQYSPRTKRWINLPVLEKKAYSYIPELMQEILVKTMVKDEGIVGD
ncbi:uncharacterized protein [Apostichopus japonicus]|uniref:uncharacterized protein isoform X4 n=1 Tax=Stichopus japonicus TaxID=307972 RepID=UPI003AB8BB46